MEPVDKAGVAIAKLVRHAIWSKLYMTACCALTQTGQWFEFKRNQKLESKLILAWLRRRIVLAMGVKPRK